MNDKTRSNAPPPGSGPPCTPPLTSWRSTTRAERQHVKREHQDVPSAPRRSWADSRSRPPRGVVVIALAAVIAAHLASPTGTGAPPEPQRHDRGRGSSATAGVLHDRDVPGGWPERPAVPGTAHRRRRGHRLDVHLRRQRRLGRVPHRRRERPRLLLRPLPVPQHHRGPVTTFYRITITGSGRISGFAPAARPVQGMVTDLAVSPDGSRMAYTAVPGAAQAAGIPLPASGLRQRPGSVHRSRPDLAEHGRGQGRWQRTVLGAGRPHAHRRRIRPRAPARPDLTVFGLDTASSGGSLQAHSTILLVQSPTLVAADKIPIKASTAS